MNMWMDRIHVIMVIISGFHVLIRWFYYIWVWFPPHTPKKNIKWMNWHFGKQTWLADDVTSYRPHTSGFPSYLWVPEGISVLHPAGNTLELHVVMIGEKTEEMT